MTVDLTISHINANSAATYADGAYCFALYSGNVSIGFYQEIAKLPGSVSVEIGAPPFPDTKSSDILTDTCEGEVRRVMVGSMLLPYEAAVRLAKELNSAIQLFEEKENMDYSASKER